MRAILRFFTELFDLLGKNAEIGLKELDMNEMR